MPPHLCHPSGGHLPGGIGVSGELPRFFVWSGPSPALTQSMPHVPSSLFQQQPSSRRSTPALHSDSYALEFPAGPQHGPQLGAGHAFSHLV